MSSQLDLFPERVRLTYVRHEGGQLEAPTFLDTASGSVVSDMGDLVLVRFDGEWADGDVRGCELLCERRYLR